MNKEFKLTSQREAAAESYKTLQENRKRDWGLYGVSFGIKELDEGLGGIMPAEVLVLGARSSIGKSAIIGTFFAAGSKVRGGKKASFIFFSWEGRADVTVNREICRKMGITQGFMLNAARLIGNEKMKKIDKIYKEVSKYEIAYQQVSTNVDVITRLVKEYCETCKERTKKDGVQRQVVAIVDFVQLARHASRGKKTEQISDFMNGIKDSANETLASYILLSQLQRGADPSKPPIKDNLSDSKSLEEVADSMVLLWRPEHDGVDYMIDPETKEEISAKNKIMYRIQKSRKYGISDVIGGVNIKYMRFFTLGKEWDWDYYWMFETESYWLNRFKLNKKNSEQEQLKLN